MSYLSHVGSFNIDPAVTVGNTQSIINVGFQPKIVLFWWSGGTATIDEVAGGNINGGFGAAIDSTHRYCIYYYSLDAAATSDVINAQNNDGVIKAFTDGTGAIDGAYDFSSMDADGFSLLVSNQFSNAYRISYLALGGDDLTNVYIGDKQTPASTGEYNVSGVGFQPDAVILFSVFPISVSSAITGFSPSLGIATGSTHQGVTSIEIDDAVSTTNSRSYGYNAECLVWEWTSFSPQDRQAFVSFNADGFRLNCVEYNSQYYFYYIALKGGQYSVGDILTRTDGNDIAETVGFQPSTLLFLSVNRALSTVNQASDHCRLNIGAATSISNRACAAISDEDNLADTETAHANYDSAVYAHVVDDDTTGIMDLKSVESTGFTCVMDENDASACWVTYLAIGENPTGAPTTITATATATVVDWCEP